jgi:hypothetical protein
VIGENLVDQSRPDAGPLGDGERLQVKHGGAADE